MPGQLRTIAQKRTQALEPVPVPQRIELPDLAVSLGMSVDEVAESFANNRWCLLLEGRILKQFFRQQGIAFTQWVTGIDVQSAGQGRRDIVRHVILLQPEFDFTFYPSIGLKAAGCRHVLIKRSHQNEHRVASRPQSFDCPLEKAPL